MTRKYTNVILRTNIRTNFVLNYLDLFSFSFFRDYVHSGSVYKTPNSGGECGVPYETYFQMPTQAKDKPWYSIEQAVQYFTVISTEHDWSVN
jgi:hypothetical protein